MTAIELREAPTLRGIPVPTVMGLPRCPRLRPGVAVVQRSPGCVQVGLRGEVLLLDGVPDHLVTMLNQLDGRSSVTDLLRREDAGWLPWLLTTLHQHHLLLDGVVHPARRSRVRVLGHGPTVAALLPLLLDAEVELTLVDQTVSPRTGRNPVRTLAASLAALGRVQVEPYRAWDESDADLTIVAGDVCEPDRVLTDRMLRTGSAHLVVRLQPGIAMVGPLVDPGRSACLRCADLRRSRAEPAWRMVALQLSRQQAPRDRLLETWAAATAAFHALKFMATRDSELLGASLHLERDGGETYHRWPPHPDCGCHDLIGLGPVCAGDQN